MQSEAAIATREEDIIRAQPRSATPRTQLRRLLNLPPGALWETAIEPTTEPEIETRVAIDVDEAIRTALAERPELARRSSCSIEQARIDAAARNQQPRSKPHGSNLDGRGYGYSGDPSRVTGGFSDALDQVTGLDFHGWTRRAHLRLPDPEPHGRGPRAPSPTSTSSSAQASSRISGR